MNPNLIQQRQMFKNFQSNNLKIEDTRGISECNDTGGSPRKYNSLIKRFNKKPNFNENSHLKYLKNGIKDISNRNINFQLQNSESQSCLQQIERLNAIQKMAEKLVENEQDKASVNYYKQSNQQTQYNFIPNNQEIFVNTCHENQAQVKPIKTIFLNLFDQNKQEHININEERYQNQQLSDTERNIENIIPLEWDKFQNTLPLDIQHQINLVKMPPETSCSALSNSTRFSPRYSQSGINCQSSSSLVSQICNKQQRDEVETKKGFEIIFDQYEISQNNLNLNDSTLTTITKYQQFDQQQNQNGSYYYDNNTKVNNMNQNVNNMQNKQTKDSQQLFSSYFQNNQQSISNTNNYVQQGQSIYNKNSSPINKQKSSLSPDHSSISKVNLNSFQRNTSKSYFVSGTNSHLNSNLHSRKSSSQIQINDSNNTKINSNTTPKNNNKTLEIKNNLSQYNYSRRDSSNKPHHNHSHSLISNIACSTQPVINMNKVSNFHLISRRVTKDSIKSSEQTPFLSKKVSSQFYQEDTNNEKINQNTLNKETLNTQVNRIQQQNIQQNNSQPYPGKLQLVQNMNRIQLISSTPSQNTQIKQKERDSSQLSMKGENKKTNNIQRSTSKGNLILKNKSLSSQTQSALNKSQLNNTNQTNTIINTSGINNTKQIISSQNNGFTFCPQYFTPIDNDQMEVYLSKKVSRNNSQVREKIPQTVLSQNSQLKANNIIKQRQQEQIQQEQIQQEFKITDSFVELESTLQNNLKQQQQFELQKKLKIFQ